MERDEFGHPIITFEEKEAAREIQERDTYRAEWGMWIGFALLFLPFIYYVVSTYITEGRLPSRITAFGPIPTRSRSFISPRGT